MKTIYSFFLIVMFSIISAQENTSVYTQYRLKPDRNVAKENYYFGFMISEGKLYTNDKDLNIQKEYFIRYKNSSYDNAGLFNLIFETDAVKQTLNRSKSGAGIFLIMYDEKKGNIVGVRVLTEISDEIY